MDRTILERLNRDGLYAIIKVYAEDAKSLSADNDRLRSIVDGLRDEAAEWENQLDDAREARDANILAAGALQSKVNQLEADYAELEAAVEDDAEMIEMLQDESTAAECLVGDLQNEIKDLNGYLDSYAEQISSLTNAVDCLAIRRDELRGELADALDKLDDAGCTINELDEQNYHLQHDLDTSYDERDKLMFDVELAKLDREVERTLRLATRDWKDAGLTTQVDLQAAHFAAVRAYDKHKALGWQDYAEQWAGA